MIYQKLQRSKEVCQKWMNYISRYPDKTIALRDFFLWSRSVLPRRTKNYFDTPWINYRAIQWLDDYLQPNMKVFEWGSGGSTIFYAKRVEEVISIEHNQEWHNVVNTQIINSHLRNVKLLYKPPQTYNAISNLTEAEIKLYKSTAKGFENKFFYTYIQAISEFPDKYFDMIMVDGRARLGCLAFARQKIKTGGSILLDNSDVPEYCYAFENFSNDEWVIQHIEGGVSGSIYPALSRMSIFRKE